jgi:uncharacterized protein YjiS (DUF1127 family)
LIQFERNYEEIAMREYVANEARSRLSTFSFSALRQLVRNWRARRKLAKLHLLDDHQLKDIGLTRGQLQHITGLPLSVDPVWEADRLRLVASHQKPELG